MVGDGFGVDMDEVVELAGFRMHWRKRARRKKAGRWTEVAR